VRPDFGAQRLEYLQAVEMVGVVVADDHPPDRLPGDLADQADEFLGQRRRGQRVEHHHAVARDDESGVRHEALVFAGTPRQAGPARSSCGRQAHRFHRYGRLHHVDGRGRVCGRQQDQRQQGEQAKDHGRLPTVSCIISIRFRRAPAREPRQQRCFSTQASKIPAGCGLLNR